MASPKNKTKASSKPQQSTTRKWVLPLIIILAVAVIASVYLLTQKSDTSGMPATITVQEAAQQFADGAFLLDVRTQEEWNQSHVEGAVLIPLAQLAARSAELPADRDVLIICRSGNRSGQARDLLRNAGFDRTTSIGGGINAWIAKGLPVVTGP